MPVIVVGADTERGRRLAERLAPRAAELRVFISDPETLESMRKIGAKVALGDLSDGSHLEGAATGAFCAVVLLEAARDGRELAFSTPETVAEEWFNALRSAGITRLIVVGEDPALPEGFSEGRVVPTAGRPDEEILSEILALEEAASV